MNPNVDCWAVTQKGLVLVCIAMQDLIEIEEQLKGFEEPTIIITTPGGRIYAATLWVPMEAREGMPYTKNLS